LAQNLTRETLLQVLANTYNDPHKKAKARALYRNLRVREQERFDLHVEVHGLSCTGWNH
jgi:hypothetical protein